MARKKDTPQKAALRKIMSNYMKENVSAKYSCGFSNLLDSSIIVNER